MHERTLSRNPTLIAWAFLAAAGAGIGACAAATDGRSDDIGTDADADSDTDGDADGDSDSDADSDADADTDGDTDGDSDGDSDSDSDGDTDSATDTGTGSDTSGWCVAAGVFVNELHYDNDGTDIDEGIEVAGPAGTDLSGYTLVLYNGADGEPYDYQELTGVLDDEQGGMGTASFEFAQIQNGAPDGVVLVQGATDVIQFLSWEGTFEGVSGPVQGLTSTDIGIEQDAMTIGDTLQLGGVGCAYGDFTWSVAPGTFGQINAFQVFGTD